MIRKMKLTRLFVLLAFTLSLIVITGCDENCADYEDDYSPSIPAGVYSVTGDEQVTLYWAPVVEHDFDYYVVYRSDFPPGPYEEIATTEEAFYVDDGLTNGVTYYYSITSVDAYGNESELSIELVYDTPRPEGSATLTNYHDDASSAGFSFANEQVVDYNESSCDIYLEFDAVLDTYFIHCGRYLTDLQDFGYTDDIHDVNYAPEEGWSELCYVEVISGHSYIVWTAENHYAVFRVTSIYEGTSSSKYIRIDWAYQTDLGNRELRINPENKIKSGNRE